LVDTPEQVSHNLFERSAVYGLLGRLWVREIDEVTCQQLVSGELGELLKGFGGALGTLDPANLDELSVDYCRSFIGPREHVSLLQSVATGGLLNGPPVDSMRDYLQYVNVPQTERQMLDHFGFQLLVMSAILAFEVEGEELEQIRRGLASSFFRDHIMWARQLFERASQRAGTEFYRSMIELTHDFIESELDRFSNRTAKFSTIATLPQTGA